MKKKLSRNSSKTPTTILLKLTPELHKRLTIFGKREVVNRTAIVTAAIEGFLNHWENHLKCEGKRKRAS